MCCDANYYMSSTMHRNIQNNARLTINIPLLIVDFALGKMTRWRTCNYVFCIHKYIRMCHTHMHAFTHRDIHRDTNIMLEYFKITIEGKP